jgi:hypothetical protein
MDIQERFEPAYGVPAFGMPAIGMPAIGMPAIGTPVIETSTVNNTTFGTPTAVSEGISALDKIADIATIAAPTYAYPGYTIYPTAKPLFSFAQSRSLFVGIIVVVMIVAIIIIVAKPTRLKSPFYSGMQSSYGMYKSRPYSVY